VEASSPSGEVDAARIILSAVSVEYPPLCEVWNGGMVEEECRCIPAAAAVRFLGVGRFGRWGAYGDRNDFWRTNGWDGTAHDVKSNSDVEDDNRDDNARRDAIRMGEGDRLEEEGWCILSAFVVYILWCQEGYL